MSDELHNLNQFSSSDPHSPAEQVRCLLCQTVPDQYISLDCKDDFCLVCLAQKYYEMKQSHEVLINDYNNYEIHCPACKSPTLLDEASINALEETLNLMKAETKKNDLFNEIILEDSAENYNNEDGLKGEEKKSFEAKYYNGLSFLARNSLDEEQKDKDTENYEKFDFFKDKNSLKQKTNSIENEKIQESLDFDQKKIMNEVTQMPMPEKKEKEKKMAYLDSNVLNSQIDEINEKYMKNGNNGSFSIEPRCQKHKNEITNLFCFTCETSCLCVECLVEGVHRNHNVKNVAKGSEFLNEKLNKLNEKINQKSYENKEILQRLEIEKQTAVLMKEENINAIQANFKEVRQKLNQKEQEILKEFENKANEKVSQIDQMIQELQQSKDLFITLQPSSFLDKLNTTAQISYYNNYSETMKKIVKSFAKKPPLPSELKLKELKNSLNLKTMNYLMRTIESLNHERHSAKKIETFETTTDLNSFNRKLRMESEYMQELPQTNENYNNNDVHNTQSSSFLGTVHDFKLPRRNNKSVRNPFKNLLLSSEKSSLSFKTKELKTSSEGFNFSSKGWSKTPTHSNEAYLELQKQKFEKQKEFFFSKF